MSILAVVISVLVITLIIIVSFVLWLRFQTGFSTQDKIGSWEIFVKLIGGVGIIMGSLFTAWQYLDQREIEFAQQNYNDKGKVYDEAIVAVSSLAGATTLSDPTTQQDLKTFWDLYWGKMVRYENKEVESAMVKFGDALKNWRSTGDRPGELRNLSHSVSVAIRDDLASIRP